MDECLARCVIDFSGRAYLVWRGLDDFAYKKLTKAERGQDMSSAFRFGLAREFFQGFANEARCNLHLELLYGDEPHHIVEACSRRLPRPWMWPASAIRALPDDSQHQRETFNLGE